MVRRKGKVHMASVSHTTETEPTETNSELGFEETSSTAVEVKGDEEMEEGSSLSVKEGKEVDDDAEGVKEKNKENEKEEVIKDKRKEDVKVDKQNEETNMDEGKQEVDTKELCNKEKVNMVQENKGETKKDGGKTKRVIKKTITLTRKKKVASKNVDKGIVSVKDGNIKKNVKGDKKNEEMGMDEQKIKVKVGAIKKEIKINEENKEVNVNDKKKEKLQNKEKRKSMDKVDDSAVAQKTKKLKNKERASTENGEQVATVAGAVGKKSDSGRKEGMGLIFMCSRNTKKDCFKYKVLGLPANKKELVAKVYKGMRLFLFDFDSKLMYGIYKAAEPGGYNIEPKAFNSAFPSQVRFKVLSECAPLPEEKFKAAIKDNYVGKKFNIELTSEQVKNLCKLFVSGSNSDKASRSSRLTRVDTTSDLIDERRQRPVRRWELQEGVRDRLPARSSRIHGLQMESVLGAPGLSREADEPFCSIGGRVRESEPLRVHRLLRDSALASGARGRQRESLPTSGVHLFTRESVRRGGDIYDREVSDIYDRQVSDIYDREVYALPPPPPLSYVHEDSLHADLCRREMELEKREQRLLELERRQQEMIRYKEPYQYSDSVAYDDQLLPRALDYTSLRRY